MTYTDHLLQLLRENDGKLPDHLVNAPDPGPMHEGEPWAYLHSLLAAADEAPP